MALRGYYCKASEYDVYCGLEKGLHDNEQKRGGKNERIV